MPPTFRLAGELAAHMAAHQPGLPGRSV